MINRHANPNHRTLFAIAIATALALPLAPAIADDRKEQTSIGQTVENAAITASIKTRLMADERTKAFDINVDTDANGRVLLRGTAPSQASKLAAGEIARGVGGVTSVENALVVAPEGSVAERSAPPATASQAAERTGERTSGPINDAWITGKVKAALLADTDVKGLAIDVDTHNRVVFLKGEVPSLAMQARAIEVAAGIEGVTRVDTSMLTVKR